MAWFKTVALVWDILAKSSEEISTRYTVSSGLSGLLGNVQEKEAELMNTCGSEEERTL